MADPDILVFLRQLRQRRLVQWALAYVAAAWVLLQAAELLFGIFGWSDAALRRFTVGLAFGFAVALVVAWYHGEKGQQRASVTELGLLVGVAAAAGWVLWTGDFGGVSATTNQFEGLANRRVTADSFYIAEPSWAPDSQSLVYMSEESGNRDLWVWSRSGDRKRLTEHPAEESQPAWSPDGRTILFVSSRAHGDKVDRSVFYGYSIGGDIWSVPAFGGEPQRVIDNGFNPSWAPDGRRFAFDSSRGGARRIWTAAADGTDPQLVSPADADLAQHVRPAWSPDGEWIAYERKTGSQSGASNLVVAAVDGSRTFALTAGPDRSMAPTWADADSIVFASDRGSALNLWQIDVDLQRGQPRGTPVQVTLGAGEDFDPAIAADGTLAYVTIRRLENLWQVDIDPQSFDLLGEPQRLMAASWNDVAPAVSLDNKRTAFSSDRTGNTDIWLLEADGKQIQLTDEPGLDLQPVWSHDDQRIAYFSNTRGVDDVYILQMDGGQPVPITPAGSNDISPYWSSDSTRIAFASDRSGRSEVWTMNIDGNGAEQLSTIGTTGHTARWSPDDEWVLFTSVENDIRDIWAVTSDGTRLQRVTDLPTQDAHGLWSADGQHVLYLSDHRKVFVTEFGSAVHRLVYDAGERIDYLHLSRDGSLLQFTRQKIESDIWMIEPDADYQRRRLRSHP